VATAIQTEPAGVRPRPVGDGSGAMREIPVMVRAVVDGVAVWLPVEAWELRPTVKDNVGALVLEVSIPSGYALRRLGGKGGMTPEADAEIRATLAAMQNVQLEQKTVSLPVTAEMLADARHVDPIPEFDGLDPAIFAFGADEAERLNMRQRERNKKPEVGTQQT
jgi:hypothetical protein